MNRRTFSVAAPHTRTGTLMLVAALLAFLALAAPRAARADACTAPVTNPVACENSQTGSAPSDWQVDGEGSSTIQGFATSQSVNKGDTIGFKIKSSTTSYHIDIYRLGYYGGLGARLWQGNLTPTNTATQPACTVDNHPDQPSLNTGLIDCGNWNVSRTWTVPSNAVSGVYEAHLVRNDGQGDSKILFVVRDDSSHSDMLVSTSDSTWQAYNSYGGNSLYTCTVSCPPGDPYAYKSAFKVSYNRPLDTEDTNPPSSFFGGGEYPMVRFLEANGYNVTYTSSADVGSRASLLLNHKIFMSSGHDEYWSQSQRDAVTAARNAGVNLAFFSGNEIYWRTRWENSIAGTTTANRTLVAYKDTHFNAPTDPVSWTGAWADPRYTAANSGIEPANSLSGQMFVVNAGTTDIKVPQAYGKLRLWRNTAAATLGTNQTLTLAPRTLGYEWDVDADNGFRPAGTIDLSSTTASGLESFTDYGSFTNANDTRTHNMTLYKASSGALVFGAGTVQWSWGLDQESAAYNTPDRNMQQATINLFADMGVQPYAVLPGLSTATKSTDTSAPTATITSKPTSAADGSKVTLAGTATDTGGGIVAGVEVSTDGGTTWHPATGTSSWTYQWTVHGAPTATIKVRATDDSANMQANPTTATVSVTCPCSVWGTSYTPPNVVADDNTPVEVGVKFTADSYGAVTGVRFYKMTGNTGTHIGNLWTSDGTRLATATFTNESATGWQTVTFPTPVPVLPGQTYVASYYAPAGDYAATANYFWRNPAPVPEGGAINDSPPLHFPRGSSTGLFSYSGTSTFPTSSFNAGNYWVDVTWTPIAAAGQVTGVTATAGKGSATVSWTAPSSGGAPSSYVVTPYVGTTAKTATTVSGVPTPPTTTTISGLTPGTTYTFKVTATNPTGSGPASNASNAVTPTAPTAPAAPTGVSAEPATSSARVTWTASSTDGGSPITGYTITPYIGTTAQATTTAAASATSATVTGLTNGTTYTFKVTATNAIGSTASDPSAAVTPAQSIFDLTVPSVVDGGDGTSVELGVKFKSDTFGAISGLRFYKAPGNTGTHVGSLWASDGTLLARATFTSESASGWQRVSFDQPVPITANTTYVASYFAPVGHYSITPQGLASGVDNGTLHAIANSSSANGLYVYRSTPGFPTGSFNAANYGVDVMFTSMSVPGTVTGVTATAGRSSASVSWTAPSSGGTPTSYEVTPYVGATAQTTKTVTGTPLATTATVSGLTPGTSYTFKVRAVNPAGNGQMSSASNAVTPTAATAPDAPTGVTVATGNATAKLTWSPPASDGGSAITGYTVTPYVNGVAQTTTTAGASATSATITGLANGTPYTFKVSATNGVGSTASTAGAAETPGSTLLDFGTPATPDVNDNDGVEVGVKFKTDTAGQVTGLRFYKSSNNGGTHVGTLWAANGTQLARATFTGESGSGWQTVDFSAPVDVAANTTYVASYFAPQGHYSATGQAFSTALDNAPLHAIADGVSANGVYGYTSAPRFPVSSFNAANYWVDVLFTATAAPDAPTGVTATAGKSAADVSWTAPSGGTTPTSYEVVPYVGSVAQTSKVVSGSPLSTSTTINGLTAGTSYTFKVRGINGGGNGVLSSASGAVTPFDSVAPDAPTNVSAAAGAASARVSWTAPASDGGSAISSYTITPFLGGTAQATTTASGSATSATATGLTNGTAYTFKVTANTAAGSTTSDASGAVTPGTTLLGFATPGTQDAGDADAIELGVKFKSDVDGQITGIRFYKATANTGTHVATLWTAGGTALARATFSGESASGWQSVDFASPVTVTAGTTYVASYRAPNGHYSATGQAFASAIDNAPLHGIADSVSSNGMYAYVYNTNPVFPYGSFNATNYWVDVLFTAGSGT
ncbi:MAG TPA: DUF4082 domain-containing protein [Baekduia sp.]|uniref:DUF4082 domain-containing protein n=1 Tax=Baekduia sp. TaxID=2600305 RepID=UPI002D78D5BB|nr:DUF4082 domain-containing protein [Baekduia sp.]HET6508231.1 DUF4082 domain-containing protein [Baekduia sp.]